MVIKGSHTSKKKQRGGGGLTLGIQNALWGNVVDYRDYSRGGLTALPAFILGGGRVSNVPVGAQGISVDYQGLRLPTLRTTPATGPTGPTITPGIDRRDITSPGPSVFVTQPAQVGTKSIMPLSDRAWFESMFPGKTYVPPGTIPPRTLATPPAPQAQIVQEKTDMPLDLGNLLTGLGSAYINAKYGAPPVPSYQQPAVYQTALGPNVSGGPELGLPFVDVIPEPPAGCDVKKMEYKWSCDGWKWVKRRRRRRKTLATKGDISQLAQLKGTVGMGKVMETWIATHS